MASDGRVQTCLRSIAMVTVTYQPGWRWPSVLGMSISVWRVRVDGLSEKPERTTLPSRVAPGIAWKRIRAVSLLVDEEGGQLGDADEDADRVGLLEDEQGPAVGAAAGLEVVARADVALGDHAVVGGLDLAVLDATPWPPARRPGRPRGRRGRPRRRRGPGRGRRSPGRASAFVSETIASAWSRAAAASSNWRYVSSRTCTSRTRWVTSVSSRLYSDSQRV